MFAIFAQGYNDICFPVYFSKKRETLVNLIETTFPDCRTLTTKDGVTKYFIDEDDDRLSAIMKETYEFDGPIFVAEVPLDTPFIVWDFD